MTVVPTRPPVDATPRLIAANTFDPAVAVSFWIQNVTATAIIFLGGDNTVTDQTGAQWDATKGQLQVELEPGEQMWGVITAGGPTQTLHVLRSGR